MGSFIKKINFGYMRDDLLRETARMAASESLKFFKESFVKGGFTDTAFKKWTDKKSPLGGKRTMYKVGILKESIRKVEESSQRVVVQSGTKYSAIHNDGGYITVTTRMKRWWWWQYSILSGIKLGDRKKGEKTNWQDKRAYKRTKSGSVANTAKNRKISAKAEFCKKMALMKVGSKIKIPQRQFMGDSQKLMSVLDGKFHTKAAEYWEKA